MVITDENVGAAFLKVKNWSPARMYWIFNLYKIWISTLRIHGITIADPLIEKKNGE